MVWIRVQIRFKPTVAQSPSAKAQFIGRDRAHACGWLIKRPWKSSPFISQILEDRVLSKKVVLIVESELFFGCTEVGGIQ